MGLQHLSPIAQLMVQQIADFMDAIRPAYCAAGDWPRWALLPARCAKCLHARIWEKIVDRLLDGFESRGSMDVIEELGEPLPAIITAEMLGVPVDDRHRLKKWSTNFAEMLGNFPAVPRRAQTMLRNTVEEMNTRTSGRRWRETNRKHPREGLINSLLTAEIGGDRLNEEEIVANVIITMVGGQETTTNLIGNGSS